jgi:hypothetical protein
MAFPSVSYITANSQTQTAKLAAEWAAGLFFAEQIA